MFLRALDCERQRLRCWLGHGGLKPDDRRALEAGLKGEKDPLRKGRILAALGRTKEAARALSRAARGLPLDPGARLELGETALLQGDAPAALALFEEAVRLDPKRSWSYVYRAAAKLKTGDAPGALQDLDRFISLEPRSAVGHALKGMLEPQSAPLAHLERALERSKEGWLYALRASLRVRSGDLDGARRDIDEAVRTEDGPWVRLERAAILNRTGDYIGALAELKGIRRDLPRSPEPHLLAADIQLDQAQYRRAAASLTKVLALDPSDAIVRRKRARVFLVQGRLDAAQEDIERTCELCPDDQYLAQESIQLMIIRDRFAEAEKTLRRRKLTAEAREFWLGYLRCRQRRYSESRDHFERSLALQKPGDLLAERAEFYAEVAGILGQAQAPKPPSGKELIVVGLGYRHPFQVTADALRSLNSCEAFFSNLSDPKVADFLGLFPVSSKAIVFRGTENQAEVSANTVMSGFSKARRTAIVTRGLPVVYGRLAWKVYEKCRRAGIGYIVPPALSIFDMLPCLTERPWETALGMHVMEPPGLASRHTALPVVLYSPKLVEGNDSRARPLPSVYPPGHVCFLLPGGGDNDFTAFPVPFGELGAAVDRSNPACVLFLPALAKRP